jgi:uncharacterized damage-inducible protein DinB
VRPGIVTFYDCILVEKRATAMGFPYMDVEPWNLQLRTPRASGVLKCTLGTQNWDLTYSEIGHLSTPSGVVFDHGMPRSDGLALRGRTASADSAFREPGTCVESGAEMTLGQSLLTQFDLEAALTRKTLERVPLNDPEWKPHDRSMPLGWLATFLALLWSWGNRIIEQTEFAPGSAAGPKPPIARTTAELLELFDSTTSAFRTALADASDDDLQKPWTLTMADRRPITQPRWLWLQTFILNHAVHHRGQLTVYLRLNGIPVPALYNDSADEKGGIFADG